MKFEELRMSQIYDTFITKYVSNVVFDLASDFEILTMYIYLKNLFIILPVN